MTKKSHEDIGDLFTRAGSIFITRDAGKKYNSWADAIDAPSIKPAVPTTRAEATPHVVLCDPFKGDPLLVGVAFYIGIGFIAVRKFDGTYRSYETSVIDGDGMEERDAFLTAALALFFNDIDFTRSPRA